jgi:hypothetical protein
LQALLEGLVGVKDWTEEGFTPICNDIIIAIFGPPPLRPTEVREEEKEERGDEGGEDEDDECDEGKEEGGDDDVDDIGNLFDELSVSGLSAVSKLIELQAFIDRHALAVRLRSGTGQYRTKVAIYNDISAVAQGQNLRN